MPSDDDVVRPPQPETSGPGVRGPAPPTSDSYSSTLSGVVRVSWLLFLPLVILVHLGWLAANDAAMTALPNLSLAASLAALVLVRFVDVAHFRGETADGGRATMADFRRFALTSVVVCGGAWAFVHSL